MADLLAYEPEPTPEPDRTPRDNRIVTAPATPAACAADYADGARVRAELDKQMRTGR
ncbi:hypothetical protein GCM10010497_45880 [Streptomyces cinereoruber]|uniref:Uncharacterized protein n=1 Tax=Streptomyces cinereoruber TaxID=67260 RepID=A0AAV4KQ25_9ACTN|nr:hypothetical protein [Streptomyces cinereoruber]MBB4160057.1 hypothetical protein [Streptomyces cinereoruber]MBY8818332.1 hypothetical protein [Streptomyces cinereoruber]NIH60995.1 hypothetical protein [Streptomyces cinereoruber]GGR37831.1 hypothetical protein GCM10010497_45880 [Streptomyces cinereoruber]